MRADKSGVPGMDEMTGVRATIAPIAVLEEVVRPMRAALDEEIAAVKCANRRKPIKLEPGTFVERRGLNYLYRFRADGAPPRAADVLYRTASGREHEAAVVDCRRAKGKGYTVTIALPNDFREIAGAGQLIVDDSWMLERIKDRLDALPKGFNIPFALAVTGKTPVPLPPKILPDVAAFSGDLNERQLVGLQLSQGAPIAAVFGPPGTGKTHVLAAAVQLHVENGRTVLCCANSNEAVDNAALAAIPRLTTLDGVGEGAVLRIGPIRSAALQKRFGDAISFDAIHARLAAPLEAKLAGLAQAVARSDDAEECAELNAEVRRLVAELGSLRLRIMARCRVLFTTAYRAAYTGWFGGTWDAVALDECASVPLPLVMILAGGARAHFACFGDNRQTGAVVIAKTDRARMWLKRDVLTILGLEGGDGMDHVPHAVMLQYQRRMAPAICALVNDVFYDGQLRVDPAVRRRKDRVSCLAGASLFYLDTSRLGARTEAPPGGGKVNSLHLSYIEAILTRMIEEGELRLLPGDWPRRAAVIAPYRHQVRAASTMLRSHRGWHVRALTAHQMQGGEASVVLMCLTDAPGTALSPFFQSDSSRDGARMLNVAASRARDTLVVLANFSHLMRGNVATRRFLTALREHGTEIDPRDFPLQPQLRAG